MEHQSNKIVRSICLFSESPRDDLFTKAEKLENVLSSENFLVQTKRFCFAESSIAIVNQWTSDPSHYLSVGSLQRDVAQQQLSDFLRSDNLSFNLDLTDGILMSDVDFLFEIIQKQPQKTFNFAYTFHNELGSPYFPSATYHQPGFALGLQPTDLSEGCKYLEEWLQRMRQVWHELIALFANRADFLGIDSSIAPLFSGKSSLVHWVKQHYGSLAQTTTTDFFLKITEFIKKENPKPVGLCGLMFPCLEDFELAEEYAKGQFTMERNLFLSLHSGLGVDTYPIGIDESKQRVLEILCVIQKLSNKYHKPLSARFVSDGKSKIGQMTNFENQYLKDTVIRNL